MVSCLNGVGLPVNAAVLKDSVEQVHLLMFAQDLPVPVEKVAGIIDLAAVQLRDGSGHEIQPVVLGEIAEELGVSRQAVHDNLQRARHILNDYESKLHLVEQYEQREGLLSQLKENLPEEVLAETKVQKVLAQMEGYYGI